MYERTITIGSAGKTFSVTGWKTGWAYGPERLLHNLKVVHQNCVYTCPTPIQVIFLGFNKKNYTYTNLTISSQEALAIGFEDEMEKFGTEECYFTSLPKELIPKRDFMAKMLTDVGMSPTIPEGGYFMVANWSRLGDKVNLEEESDQYRDYRFTKWMTKKVGIQGIPPSAFYSDKHKHLGEDNVRYCFMKVCCLEF